MNPCPASPEVLRQDEKIRKGIRRGDPYGHRYHLEGSHDGVYPGVAHRSRWTTLGSEDSYSGKDNPPRVIE